MLLATGDLACDTAISYLRPLADIAKERRRINALTACN
jgi:hypothetical protein